MGDKPFEQKVDDMVAKGFASLSLSLGCQLDLFKHLTNKPQSPAEIAQSADCKERYMEEWLKSMALVDIIQTDESGTKFWILDQQKDYLTKYFTMTYFLPSLPMLANAFNDCVACFKKDGPLGTQYKNYRALQDWLGDSGEESLKRLAAHVVTAIPGISEILENGGRHLDIGCGRGIICLKIAQIFPSAETNGVDKATDVIQRAKDEAQSQNVKNAIFYEGDATALPDSWTNSFDYATASLALHQMSYPNKALKEILRVLKPGGYFSAIECMSHANVNLNRPMKNACSWKYALGMFFCVPVSASAIGGAGLGCMWGVERCQKMLEDVGFDNVKTEMIPEEYMFHCYGQKPLKDKPIFERESAL